MANVVALECFRCGTKYPPTAYAQDCPSCRGVARSNLTVVYEDGYCSPRSRPAQGSGEGLFLHGDVMPYSPQQAVTLGEGNSQLHHLERTGSALGLPQLFAKDETRNPTWSFKDRLASSAVSVARKLGAKTIVSSSSGNAGAAAAAYAAKAGLPCVIFTFKGSTGPMLTQMRAYGARVVLLENKADRWTLMQEAVASHGWFPTSPFFGPAVGSNPYGIEGYKSLAYEIAAQMNWQVPDWCVLPVCYGDALLGMWRGFSELMTLGWTDRMPRLVAAEVYGSIGTALTNGGDTLPDIEKTYDTVAVSIGATRGTYQALEVVRRSRGDAVRVADPDMMRWQQTLARDEGLFVEPSSACALAAIETLVANKVIASTDSVVALLTASGLKDPSTTSKYLKEDKEEALDLEGGRRLLASFQ